MLKIDNISLIKRLNMFLDEHEYDLINQVVRGTGTYFFDPIPDYNSVKVKLNALNFENKQLIELLLLGEIKLIDSIVSMYGQWFIDCLIELGLAVIENENIRLDNYIIVSYTNKYFIVNTPFRNPNCKVNNGDVYIGFDTYRLTNNLLNRVTGKVLDLCTGSGIQAICIAPYAKEVVGVELNKNASNVAKFNCILNNVEDKVKIVNGDLYSKLGEETYDNIYSNPPFIPIPNNLKFPMCGAGGELGVDVIKRIIAGYDKYLSCTGTAMIVGECLGNENSPFIKELLEETLSEKYDSTVILMTKNTAESQINRTLNLAIKVYDNKINYNEAFDKWSLRYKELGINCYYSFVLKVKRNVNNTGRVDVINLTHLWNEKSVPKLKVAFDVVKLNTIYGILGNGKLLSSINQNTIDILNLIDDKRSIEEIYEVLHKNSKLSERSRAEVIEDIINLFSLMQQSNVIEL